MKKTAAKVDVGLTRGSSKRDREMAFLVEKYVDTFGDEVEQLGALDPEHITQWAFDTGFYKPLPRNPKDILRRKVSQHLGHRYLVDPQGRMVRALHAVPVPSTAGDSESQKKFRYFPLFTTEAEIIKAGFQLRRRWAFQRVEQIETDRVSYNDNNTLGQTIDQMSFDFDTQLIESKQPTEYSPEPPDDFDSDDDRPREE